MGSVCYWNVFFVFFLLLESGSELNKQQEIQLDEKKLQEKSSHMNDYNPLAESISLQTTSKVQNGGKKYISSGEHINFSGAPSCSAEAEKTLENSPDELSNIDQSFSEILNLGKFIFIWVCIGIYDQMVILSISSNMKYSSGFRNPFIVVLLVHLPRRWL